MKSTTLTLDSIAAMPATAAHRLAHTAHRARRRLDDLCPLCARYDLDPVDNVREEALGSDPW